MKFIIYLLILPFIISCVNKETSGRPGFNDNDSIIDPTRVVNVSTSEIDKTEIITNLQGVWIEIEYPFNRAEFKGSTVKFIEEGVAERTRFEKFDISTHCPFVTNNIREVGEKEIIIILPENERCEKIKVSGDTLTFTGFNITTQSAYQIVYKKAE